MKNYKATATFIQIIEMKKGETKKLDPKEYWVRDLINGGFLEEVKKEKISPKK